MRTLDRRPELRELLAGATPEPEHELAAH